jgi:hypothetical protein
MTPSQQTEKLIVLRFVIDWIDHGWRWHEVIAMDQVSAG